MWYQVEKIDHHPGAVLTLDSDNAASDTDTDVFGLTFQRTAGLGQIDRNESGVIGGKSVWFSDRFGQGEHNFDAITRKRRIAYVCEFVGVSEACHHQPKAHHKPKGTR